MAEILTFRTTVRPGDQSTVRDIVTSTGFFYDIEIDVAADLVEEKIIEGEQSSYKFIFAELCGRPVAYSCFGHIAGSRYSYDLYWIVTHNDFRGQGLGKQLLDETHRQIAASGGQNVIAETSSLEKYEPTRLFYRRMGYTQAGLIRDFYSEGDDNITFVKRI